MYMLKDSEEAMYPMIQNAHYHVFLHFLMCVMHEGKNPVLSEYLCHGEAI